MPDEQFSATVHAAFAAFNDRRFADFATYMAEDVVESYPQSGEALVGRTLQQAFHEAFPGPPTYTIRNLRRSGDLAVVEADERYEDGSVWKDVFILELRGDVVASMTGYFGEPFPAPEWRHRFMTVDGSGPG